MYRLRACGFEPGTYELGPGNGTLSVRTERTGAAAKAGHNLLIEVTAWEATLTVGGRDEHRAQRGPRVAARARGDGRELQALGDDDKASIEQTIEEELATKDISFRSTRVEPGATAA